MRLDALPRIERGIEKRERGPAIERAPRVLLGGPGLKTVGKVRTAEAKRRDIEPKGREPGVVCEQNTRQARPFVDFSLDDADLAFQFCAKQADDLAYPAPVPTPGFGIGQDPPGVYNVGTVRLGCNEQLRVERDTRIFVMDLPEHQGRRGPDAGRRTTLIPLGMPEVERPFDPLREAIDLFL